MDDFDEIAYDSEDFYDPIYHPMPQWVREIYKKIKKMLKVVKIEIDVVKVAQSGSCYFYFPDKAWLGKLRIANHEEKKCYGYKWHIRSDINQNRTINQKGHNQYLYCQDKLHEFVNHVTNYDKKACMNMESHTVKPTINRRIIKRPRAIQNKGNQ